MIVFRLEVPFCGEYGLHRLTFGEGEPTVAMVAGVHGNEVNGTYALNLVAGVLRVQRPRGTVHLLPCVNLPGAADGRKRWPSDDRDVGAAFPGAANGAAVERLAAAVMAATEARLCVEVQSGATTLHELPHARTPQYGPELEAARAMGLPVTWRRAAGEDGLVDAWRQAGRRALQVRGGRGSSLDGDDARTLARGLLRLLAAQGMITGAQLVEASVETGDVDDYRGSSGGFFVPEVRTGARVATGDLLGLVRQPIGGEALEEVRAGRSGVVLGLRVYPMVHAQELLVRVAAEG
jgi:predicted deacylase